MPSDLLPSLTAARQRFRRSFRWLAARLASVLVKLNISGYDNIPLHGAVIVVFNHMADADMVLGLAMTPRSPEVLAKAPLRDFPVAGRLMQWYGCIWIEQFKPDRAALRAAEAALLAARPLALAPEGRQSPGALAQGTQGAAFLALRTGAPILPIAFEGTEHIYANMRRLRRTAIHMNIGPLFHLTKTGKRKADLQHGTEQIMHTLAQLLSPEYRGIYADHPD